MGVPAIELSETERATIRGKLKRKRDLGRELHGRKLLQGGNEQLWRLDIGRGVGGGPEPGVRREVNERVG